MGIWSRLGTVIKSYINDSAIFGDDDGPRERRADDGDLRDAYDELEDFLNGDRAESGAAAFGGRRGTEGDSGRAIPRELLADFAELGLPLTATKGECKEAYKRLLKIHHPDRHAGHAANMKKATEKSARINASYDRLLKWFEAL